MVCLSGRVSPLRGSFPSTSVLVYGLTKAVDSRVVLKNPFGEHMAAGFIPLALTKTGTGWRTGADSGFRTIRTSAATVYNDGAGPTADADRDSTDHDWSHGIFSIEGEFIYNLITVTPGIHYQSSWDDSVNSSDELWFTLTAKHTF